MPLGLEPGDHLLGVHPELDHLEGHFAADRLLLFGDIDHAAAALPNFLEQLVASERLAHGFVGRIGEIELDRQAGLVGLGGHEVVGLVVRGEQRFETLAQGIVGEAGAVQEGGAFRAGQLQSGLKNRFLAVLG